MSLDLYENAAYPTGDAISKGTMTQPLEVTVPAGQTSSAIPLWACTADTQFYYTDIDIVPRDIDGTDESDWIALAPDSSGSAGTFGAWGAPLTDIGTVDDENYVPFHVKFKVDVGVGAQIKTDLKLGMDYVKHAVAS